MKITLWQHGLSLGKGRDMGRHRKDGPREPNGRLQRDTPLTPKQIESNQSVVRAYRERVFGVDPAFSSSQMAETAIGRLLIKGQSGDKAEGISQAQYQLAIRYKSDRDAYLRAIGGKVDYQERAGTADPDEEGYQRFCDSARNRWSLVMAVIQEANRTIDAADSLWQIVIEDRDRPDMVGALRQTLNILQKLDQGVDSLEVTETGKRAA